MLSSPLSFPLALYVPVYVSLRTSDPVACKRACRCAKSYALNARTFAVVFEGRGMIEGYQRARLRKAPGRRCPTAAPNRRAIIQGTGHFDVCPKREINWLGSSGRVYASDKRRGTQASPRETRGRSRAVTAGTTGRYRYDRHSARGKCCFQKLPLLSPVSREIFAARGIFPAKFPASSRFRFPFPEFPFRGPANS